jgi:tetracycline resistance efflux pump
MQLTWLSLLPPLVVIGAMLLTQQLNISLSIGILSAALIIAHGNVFAALSLCIERLIIHFSDVDIIFLYALLVSVSSLIILLTVTGSAAACARVMSKKMKSPRSGEMCAAMLALLLSIDDYLSILTVGLVVSPMVDKLSIVRLKLAYIIRALASPLVIIMPISTWAAAILAQLNAAGVNTDATSRIFADPFYVYLKTIPFVFYSLFTIFTVWLLVITRLGYGPIGNAEQLVVSGYHTEDDQLDTSDGHKHSATELFLPIILLMVTVFVGILYAGGYHLFGGNNSLIEAFRHNNKTFLVLCVSSVVAFVVSFLVSLQKKLVSVAQLPSIIVQGFELIKSAIMMVILASVLASFLRIDLQTGSYVASILLGKAPLFLLPVLFFVTSLIITLMTGSAWGTFSMLIPIATQMLISFLHLIPPVSPDQLPMLFPLLAAILSGAACGNQLSPFAETTMMTATSAGVDALEHAKTQLWYSVPVIIATLASFTLVGLVIDYGLFWSFLISMGAGLSLLLGLLLVFYCSRKWLK